MSCTPRELQLDKERYLKRNLERPWYKHWKACRQRCNDKNASNYKWYGGKNIKCDITHPEVEILWDRDNASQMKEPQLSRNDHTQNYTFDNCCFVEKKNNVGEVNSRTKRRIILQYDLHGNFLKQWRYVAEIKTVLRINPIGVQLCARGVYRQSHNFIWRYKDE